MNLRAVRRRRVFFVAGFDPRGPDHYHATYRDEAARQSQTQRAGDGTVYTVSGSLPDGDLGVTWTVQAESGDAQVCTRYSYLAWDDLAQAQVPRGVLPWLRAVMRFCLLHLGQGGHAAAWRLARRWAWALLSLPIYVGAAALVMLTVAAIAHALAASAGAPAALRWLPALMAAVLTGGLAWRLALRWNQVWLTHALLGSYAWGLGRLPALDDRLRAFAPRIADALAEPDQDEVVVVGHCMGAMLGAVLIAQVAELCAARGQSLARLKFLTLASPMASYASLRDDVRVRPALRQLAALDIPWLDITAPQDPLCCFLVDPLPVAGVTAPMRRVRLRLRSARFDRRFDAATMRRVRRDPLQLHFLYLLATRLPVDNDFFALTAGPRTIDARVQADGPPQTG